MGIGVSQWHWNCKRLVFYYGCMAWACIITFFSRDPFFAAPWFSFFFFFLLAFSGIVFFVSLRVN